MRRRLALVVTLGLLALGGTPLRAQVRAQAPRRQQLERAFGERLATIVQRRLEIDDATLRRLQRTNQRFEKDRRGLLADERQTRQALRAEVAAGAEADQSKVAALMDRALQLQRRRLDLLEAEQRALAEFLTPVQRAKYFALEEALRRRAQELQRARARDSLADPRP